MEDAVGTLCAWSFLWTHVGSLGWWPRPCWGCDLWGQDNVTHGCQGAQGTVRFHKVPQRIKIITPKHCFIFVIKRMINYDSYGTYEQCRKSRKTCVQSGTVSDANCHLSRRVSHVLASKCQNVWPNFFKMWLDEVSCNIFSFPFGWFVSCFLNVLQAFNFFQCCSKRCWRAYGNHARRVSWLRGRCCRWRCSTVSGCLET